MSMLRGTGSCCWFSFGMASTKHQLTAAVKKNQHPGRFFTPGQLAGARPATSRDTLFHVAPSRDLWPAGLIIAVDTREQAPYDWPGHCQRATLATGDYAILGHEQVAAVERKSLPDLLGSIGQGRERFKREFERLAALAAPALVIEADLPGILAGTERSSLHPAAVMGTLASWSVRWRIPVWFAHDRRHGAALVALLLRQAWRHHVGSLPRAPRA